MSENAWLIRNDGAAIPCVQHIYANKAEVYETLYAAQWLYLHTSDAETQIICLRFIKSYGVLLSQKDFLTAIQKDIEAKPYIFLTQPFIHSVREELLSVSPGDTEALGCLVEKALNQEFLRARYGGLYYTAKGKRDMYFRISSVGFDWYACIFDFLKRNKTAIDTVTIVRDEESTGMRNYVYALPSGQRYDKLPLDIFWHTEKHILM